MYVGKITSQHPHRLVFFLLAKYRHMANSFFKNANFGDFFQKLIFVSPKFSSDLTIFHPFEQIFIKL
jgi:hypothetical protein